MGEAKLGGWIEDMEVRVVVGLSQGLERPREIRGYQKTRDRGAYSSGHPEAPRPSSCFLIQGVWDEGKGVQG